MTDNTPWYLRTTDTTSTDKGSPERNRKHVQSIAETASAEADAMVTHLRNAEAQGVAIPADLRMSMGYATNARKAAAQLGDSGQRQTSVTDGDMTPEQRIARGYGAGN